MAIDLIRRNFPSDIIIPAAAYATGGVNLNFTH